MYLLWPLILVIVLIISLSGKNTKILKDRRISKNFTLGELVHTNTGLRNVPNDIQIKNLEYVVLNFLQPLRDIIGQPIFITSGFRSKEVNDRIGGSFKSQHLKGEAIDFATPNITNNKLIHIAKENNLPFDQIIDEQVYNLEGIRNDWVHVSLKQAGNRSMHLKARNTKSDRTVRYRLV